MYSSAVIGPNDAAANTQDSDQTLLKALQDLIVRVMDPMQKIGILSIDSRIACKRKLSSNLCRCESDTLGARGGKVNRGTAGVYFHHRCTLSV